MTIKQPPVVDRLPLRGRGGQAAASKVAVTVTQAGQSDPGLRVMVTVSVLGCTSPPKSGQKVAGVQAGLDKWDKSEILIYSDSDFPHC